MGAGELCFVPIRIARDTWVRYSTRKPAERRSVYRTVNYISPVVLREPVATDTTTSTVQQVCSAAGVRVHLKARPKAHWKQKYLLLGCAQDSAICTLYTNGKSVHSAAGERSKKVSRAVFRPRDLRCRRNSVKCCQNSRVRLRQRLPHVSGSSCGAVLLACINILVYAIF